MRRIISTALALVTLLAGLWLVGSLFVSLFGTGAAMPLAAKVVKLVAGMFLIILGGSWVYEDWRHGVGPEEPSGSA